MAHSHILVEHLLKQVEAYREKRAERSGRPRWITEFVHEIAELFEPLTDSGRVGFDCRLTEECWVVAMYLGSTEVVGGKDDGQARHMDFEFDLLELLRCFTEIERFQWRALPSRFEEEQTDPCMASYIVVDGRVDDNLLRLQLYSVPPLDAGPGFRQYPDGRRETV